jgi:hypothetical protein
MNYKLAFWIAGWGCLCCLISGCAFNVPSGNRSECSVMDSQPNRWRAVKIVSSLAVTNGIHDETERQLARPNVMNSPGGYTLLAAYADSNRILPYRLSLRVTVQQDNICASLYERRWLTKRRSSRYLAIEEALTNAFAGAFGQGAAVTRSQ